MFGPPKVWFHFVFNLISFLIFFRVLISIFIFSYLPLHLTFIFSIFLIFFDHLFLPFIFLGVTHILVILFIFHSYFQILEMDLLLRIVLNWMAFDFSDIIFVIIMYQVLIYIFAFSHFIESINIHFFMIHAKLSPFKFDCVAVFVVEVHVHIKVFFVFINQYPTRFIKKAVYSYLNNLKSNSIKNEVIIFLFFHFQIHISIISFIKFKDQALIDICFYLIIAIAEGKNYHMQIILNEFSLIQYFIINSTS